MIKQAILAAAVITGAAQAATNLPISPDSMHVAEGALRECQRLGFLEAGYVDGVVSEFKSDGDRYESVSRGEADVHKRVGRQKIREEGKGREEAACRIFNHVLIEGIVRAERPLEDMGTLETINKDPLREDEQRLYTLHYCAGYYDVMGFDVKLSNPNMAGQGNSLIGRMLKERDLLAKKAFANGVSGSERALFNKGKAQASEDLAANRIGIAGKRVKACMMHLYK